MSESFALPPAMPALRAQLAGLDVPAPPELFALGPEALDAALGGGLERARLHEIYATEEADLAAATGFALMLALRAGGASGNIVWIAQAGEAHTIGRLHPPGVAELGADPARLLFVTVPDEKTLLRAAADVVRSPAAGIAVIAPTTRTRHIDLTASRRLTLFAERSGVTAILLRGTGEEMPSAAATRWRIAAAPSTPLEANAPGAPAFAVDLVRRRGGPPSLGWRLEWDRDSGSFRRAPLSGAVPAEDGARLLAS